MPTPFSVMTWNVENLFRPAAHAEPDRGALRTQALAAGRRHRRDRPGRRGPAGGRRRRAAPGPAAGARGPLSASAGIDVAGPARHRRRVPLQARDRGSGRAGRLPARPGARHPRPRRRRQGGPGHAHGARRAPHPGDQGRDHGRRPDRSPEVQALELPEAGRPDELRAARRGRARAGRRDRPDAAHRRGDHAPAPRQSAAGGQPDHALGRAGRPERRARGGHQPDPDRPARQRAPDPRLRSRRPRRRRPSVQPRSADRSRAALLARARGVGELLDQILASEELLPRQANGRRSLPEVRSHTEFAGGLASVTEDPNLRRDDVAPDHAPVSAAFEL